MSIDVKKAARSLGQLSRLRFFPSDDEARTGILQTACKMASTNDQIDWLVARCIELWSRWEDEREMRVVFCSKFKPADGREEMFSSLPEFVGGIPSETESASYAMLSGGAVAAQLPGEIAPDATFPRDALDLMHEAMERNKAIRTAKLPSEAEIEAIKQQQESRRAGESAVVDAEAKLAKLAGTR
jgi:hypothetical protein